VLRYSEARRKVIEVLSARRRRPAEEEVPLARALGRVLAQTVFADRPYPPFNRSTRDGFAVLAADLEALPATLAIAGEIKAGDLFTGRIARGSCVRIMTGAAVPEGADAVVMHEHAREANEQVTFTAPVERGQNIVPAGSEAAAGQPLLAPGARLGYAELAVAAQVGCARLRVFRRPRVAILSTGNEVVELEAKPASVQIRNSNSVALAALVTLAGAEPVSLGNAPDDHEALERAMARGLEEDALVLTGGVSAGKYDLVEPVLQKLGVEFHFDAVAIRPGKPAVFATRGDTAVFGLPGNPVSTMVTFQLFVVPALEILSGAEPRPLAVFRARLAQPVRRTARLAHFLPARVSWPEGVPTVEELPWQGSGDIVAVAEANAFLLVPDDRLELAVGDWVDVLPRRG
jgi:molybdopterin molybdotransferase